MRITAAGNVGIGTTVPETLLYLNSTSPVLTINAANGDAEGAKIRLSESALFQGAYIQYDGSANVLNIGVHNTADSTIANDLAAISILRSNGNVGIGTTGPAVPLEVNGAAKLGKLTIGLTSQSNPLFVFGNSTDAVIMAQQDSTGMIMQLNGNSGANRVSVLQNGNVGIGTTGPGGTLEVQPSGPSGYFRVSSGRYASQINIGTNPAGYIHVMGYLDSQTANTYDLGRSDDQWRNLYTNNAYISGNVGIGTTSPGAKLDVANTDTSLGSTIRLTGGAGVVMGGILGTINFNGGRFNNNVGKTLGQIIVGNENTQPYWNGMASNEDTYMAFSTGIDQTLVERLRITSGGFVGIGTSSPGHLITLSSGAYSDGSTWVNASDRNLKENFTPLDPQTILNKIQSLPITQWNYKSESKGITHIGPVAQDFYALFNTGGPSGETSISTIDPAGVALLGIQALNLKVNDLSSLDTTSATSLGSLMKNFLGEVGNNIGDLYAGVIHSNKSTTKNLCVSNDAGETCITRDQLDALLSGAKVIVVPSPSAPSISTTVDQATLDAQKLIDDKAIADAKAQSDQAALDAQKLIDDKATADKLQAEADAKVAQDALDKATADQVVQDAQKAAGAQKLLDDKAAADKLQAE